MTITNHPNVVREEIIREFTGSGSCVQLHVWVNIGLSELRPPFDAALYNSLEAAARDAREHLISTIGVNRTDGQPPIDIGGVYLRPY